MTMNKQAEGETLEVKLGRMASEQLRQQVPALVERGYNVGFELLDKTEDETAAFGVFGAIINNVWAYVPVFYFDGRLTGMDMLFVKNTEMFTPSKDNWIGTLAEQGTTVFGRVATEDDNEVSGSVSGDQASIESEMFPYAEKTAELSTSGMGLSAELVRSMRRRPRPVQLDLMKQAADMGPDAVAVLSRTIQKNAEFANAMFTFYSPQDMMQAVKRVENELEKTAEEPRQKVLFITDYGDPAAVELSDREKRVLMSTGIFVRDERDETSRVFGRNISTGSFTNPGEPGVYRFLMADGSRKVGLSVPERESLEAGRTVGHVYVILADSPKSFSRRLRSDVFGQPLKEVQDLPEDTEFGYAPSREGLQRILNKDGGSGDYKSCSVLLVQGSRRSLEIIVSRNPEEGIQVMADGRLVEPVFTQDGPLALEGRSLQIPKDVRLFTLAGSGDAAEFGDLGTVEAEVFSRIGLRPVGIETEGRLYSIQDGESNVNALTEKEALEHLVLDHGIFAGQARLMLKKASDSRAEFLIKHAAAYNGTTEMISPTVSQTQTEETQNTADIRNELPAMAVRRASEAAEKGKKNIFDTAVLSSLLQVADLTDRQRDYVADMLRNLDSVGRMRFLLYWHRDAFRDRFGEDLEEMEESLKSLFEQMGDTALFLRRKHAFAPDLSENLIGELSEDIGSAEPDETT